MRWSIEQAELVEWLTNYDGEKFHAVLADPPYALISITKRFGKKGSAPAKEGSDGRYARLSGGFMGQKWDGFESLQHYQEWIAEWSALLIEKALYPGAVCMFFGGTRTFHHLGVGLETGGFEIVDCLMWLQGQGFPKSHNISKGMDKEAGVEREVTGKAKGAASSDTESLGEFKPEYDETKPVTLESEVWGSYGTALKPAWEPVFLCRAPRGKHTFAQLAVEFGSGALNIDGSRISHDEPEERMTPHSSKVGKTTYNQAKLSDERSSEERASPAPNGRWPANLMLTHHEECVQAGDARWACVPGCPVRQLDDQVGELSSSFRTTRKKHDIQGFYGIHGWTANNTDEGYKDTGGPSRFFYCAKASRSEKDAGLEDFYWQRVDKGFKQVSKIEWEQLDKKQRAQGCIHPTVKPIKLLTYLALLSLPPELEGRSRRMLVPFSGSGSEMIGAARAGWDEVVGIEAEAQYTAIAEARLAHSAVEEEV
ncbi:hypothetical protein LCGC14_1032000 [marine sediment metagenome]|uniref:DNA methylase N-4/N-6 domain-containing protein n=1 Tax=marine sediment metagenome TaxID=412755 RepID=A0A0F9QCE9_9ZZZZ